MMTATTSDIPPLTPGPAFDFDATAVRLVEQGWLVLPGFLAQEAVAALRTELLAMHDRLRQATVAKARRLAPEIRGDLIHWIEEGDAGPATCGWLACLEGLRLAINRVAYLGLFDLELHYALYPPGARYTRHLDCFHGDTRRILTTILYLNPEWQTEDGGALRLWLDTEGRTQPVEILPSGGTLVLFQSARFWHEVLPARRERLSITGWFRGRA
jgi:SM-20-related protein